MKRSRQKSPEKPTRRRAEPADRAKGLDLLEAGRSIAGIARELGIDRHPVRQWRDSTEGRERMRKALAERAAHVDAQRAARARANQIICEAIERAAEVLRDELDGPDRIARLRAADSLLDRGGAPKSSKVEATVAPTLDLTKLTDEEFEQLEALSEKAKSGS